MELCTRIMNLILQAKLYLLCLGSKFSRKHLIITQSSSIILSVLHFSLNLFLQNFGKICTNNNDITVWGKRWKTQMAYLNPSPKTFKLTELAKAHIC